MVSLVTSRSISRFVRACLFVWFTLPPAIVSAQSEAADTQSNARVLVVAGKVERLPKNTTKWLPAKRGEKLKSGGRLRTGKNSRAVVRQSDLSVLRLGESTSITIVDTEEKEKRPIFQLNSVGKIFFQGRDKPGTVRFRSRQVSGAVRGTEFVLEEKANGEVIISLIDGAVELSDGVRVQSGQQFKIFPDNTTRTSAIVDTANIIQWTLYYPAVIVPSELDKSKLTSESYGAALSAYTLGDMLGALGMVGDDPPANSEEQLLQAALVLSVGKVEECRRLLSTIQSPDNRQRNLINALRHLIATVRLEANPISIPTNSASMNLAESYYLQSRGDLPAALNSAKTANHLVPESGITWARLADLQFSFGDSRGSSVSLERALTLSPDHPGAASLKGFVLAAHAKLREAIVAFDHAIELDGDLGQSWLGRGLVRFRLGDKEGGQQDIQTAGALESQRAIYRSYHGKAFAEMRNNALARKDLDLAKRLDPNDPTAWLYSALLNQNENRINAAVQDLETSQHLNNNRAIFRSKLLLDQDLAVRGANLASAYRDAGMAESSIREASRSVNWDYLNHSAHAFLSDSFDQLRDPFQVNLRYESLWFNELLLSNLLMPVGAGSLSQNVSQQEYNALFDRDGIHFNSTTAYRSDGAWNQFASLFGNYGDTALSFDVSYTTFPGDRPNNDFEQLTYYAKAKQNIGENDSLFLQIFGSDSKYGDTFQYYDQSAANLDVRNEETLPPNLLAGYHRTWSREHHSLFLFGWLRNQLNSTDPTTDGFAIRRDPQGTIDTVAALPTFSLDYESDFTIYSFEGQHIWQTDNQRLIAGARYQDGGTKTDSYYTNNVPFPVVSTNPPQLVAQSLRVPMNQATGYAYYQYDIHETLTLEGGFAYQWLEIPVNIDAPPISDETQSIAKPLPKAGFYWNPAENFNLNGAYSRAMNGLFYDASIRLEPSQVAGINQAYRSLVPESMVGPQPGSVMDILGLHAGWKLNSEWFLNFFGNYLQSDYNRMFGVFDVNTNPALPEQLESNYEFREASLGLSANYLFAEWFNASAGYTYANAQLDQSVPEVPSGLNDAITGQPFLPSTTQKSALQRISLQLGMNHPSGFFASAHGNGYFQNNTGFGTTLGGDDFWQLDLFAGWRLWNRRTEIRLGILNLTDQDYQLNPLNLLNTLPRKRMFTMQLNLFF